MEKHKFWAWSLIFCLFMTMYTGISTNRRNLHVKLFKMFIKN